MQDTEIRPMVSSDRAAIGALYPRAFPDEDLSALVAALMETPETTHLVALRGKEVVGHVCFARCQVGAAPVALLGPLAVDPQHQKSGVGRSLIEAGRTKMTQNGMHAVMVLGDPAYYGRFGFHTDHGVQGHRDMPLEWASAWQAMATGAKPIPNGAIELPAVWDNGQYWSDQST